MSNVLPQASRQFGLIPASGLPFPVRALGTCVAVVLACCGCGTSDYGSRVQKNLDGLLVGSVFTNLYDQPTQIPDTPVQIRLPKLVGSDARAFNDKSPGVDPRQLQPPGMKLPGLKVTYEMQATSDSEGPLNYYLYLGAFRPGESVPGGSTLADAVQKQLATAFPSAGAAQWTDVECLTPNLNKIAWKQIHVSGDQEFGAAHPGSSKRRPANWSCSSTRPTATACWWAGGCRRRSTSRSRPRICPSRWAAPSISAQRRSHDLAIPKGSGVSFGQPANLSGSSLAEKDSRPSSLVWRVSGTFGCRCVNHWNTCGQPKVPDTPVGGMARAGRIQRLMLDFCLEPSDGSWYKPALTSRIQARLRKQGFRTRS